MSKRLKVIDEDNGEEGKGDLEYVRNFEVTLSDILGDFIIKKVESVQRASSGLCIFTTE
jgi:hypothetical protein